MIFWNVSCACCLWPRSACAIYKLRACTAPNGPILDEGFDEGRSWPGEKSLYCPAAATFYCDYFFYGLYRAKSDQKLTREEIRRIQVREACARAFCCK